MEERLGELEQSLGKLQTHLKEQGILPCPSSGSNGKSLDSINKDLCKLREDFDFASKGHAVYKEDFISHFKDAAILFGDFG